MKKSIISLFLGTCHSVIVPMLLISLLFAMQSCSSKVTSTTSKADEVSAVGDTIFFLNKVQVSSKLYNAISKEELAEEHKLNEESAMEEYGVKIVINGTTRILPGEIIEGWVEEYNQGVVPIAKAVVKEVTADGKTVNQVLTDEGGRFVLRIEDPNNLIEITKDSLIHFAPSPINRDMHYGLSHPVE